jgi:hypothetical protein
LNINKNSISAVHDVYARGEFVAEELVLVSATVNEIKALPGAAVAQKFSASLTQQ